ncbi:hypothetical protein GQR58_027914 [Nymphon striatum]|nr:hypothetical protein GQR58_027914 [Nymphon striatum]
MASIRTIKELSDTYEDFTWKFLKSMPSGYNRIDIVADTYQDNSIKSGERDKRGSSEKIMIQSATSKAPRNFGDFLSNCQAIKKKLIPRYLHCQHALERYPQKTVIVRSHSADIDILVILLGKSECQQIYLDSGTGLHRKGMRLSDIQMSTERKRCLIGFHAFTGNDYNSSFFRKGEAACWKVLEKDEKFVSTFTALGSDWNLAETVIEDLEEFNKSIDISLLTPCQASLRLHTLRSNVVARIWKLSDEAQIQMPDLSQHGWTINNSIRWIEKAFPDELEDLLLTEETETVYEDDEESEEDNDSE